MADVAGIDHGRAVVLRIGRGSAAKTMLLADSQPRSSTVMPGGSAALSLVGAEVVMRRWAAFARG